MDQDDGLAGPSQLVLELESVTLARFMREMV